jgi:hypothetical protein
MFKRRPVDEIFADPALYQYPDVLYDFLAKPNSDEAPAELEHIWLQDACALGPMRKHDAQTHLEIADGGSLAQCIPLGPAEQHFRSVAGPRAYYLQCDSYRELSEACKVLLSRASGCANGKGQLPGRAKPK